jgi:hypothetical protein
MQPSTRDLRPPTSFDIDPDGAEYVSSDIRDHERGSLRHDRAPPYEPFGDRHAEPPREVVVARPRRRELVASGRLGERVHIGRGCCDRRQPLQRASDLRATQADATLPAVPPDVHQVRFGRQFEVRTVVLTGQHTNICLRHRPPTPSSTGTR